MGSAGQERGAAPCHQHQYWASVSKESILTVTVLERPVTSTPWSPTWNRRMRNPSLSVSIQSHHWADDEQDDRRDQLSDVRLAGTLLSVRGDGLIQVLIWRLVRGLILGSRHRFVFWACFNCCSSVASRISCEAAYSGKVILGVSEWGVWGLWGGVCPNLLYGRSAAGSGASGARGPDPILAPWEDRSGPRPGCVRRFPHDCAVLTASQSGAPRNDPPGAPCSAPSGAARSRT